MDSESFSACLHGLKQNGGNLADVIFNCIFINENSCILNKISLKYVRKGSVDNGSSLVKVVAWCLDRRQAITWTNDGPQFYGAYLCYQASMS